MQHGVTFPNFENEDDEADIWVIVQYDDHDGSNGGITRIDFLEKDGEVYVNEVNTIPGSMAAYLWIDPPLSRKELFTDLVHEAEETQTRVFSVAGSDGAALRSAGSIASKLG